MINRTYLSFLSAVCLLVILSGLGGIGCGGGANNSSQANNTLDSPTPTLTPDPCVGLPDDFIVYSIYGQMALDPDLKSQLRQVNITSKAHVVTLYGWMTTTAQHDKVINLAKNTYCVASINSDKFYAGLGNPTIPGAGGCVDPYTRCGEICIPNTDHCYLGIDSKLVANTKTSGQTNTNANVNGKAKATANANANTNTKTNTNR